MLLSTLYCLQYHRSITRYFKLQLSLCQPAFKVLKLHASSVPYINQFRTAQCSGETLIAVILCTAPQIEHVSKQPIHRMTGMSYPHKVVPLMDIAIFTQPGPQSQSCFTHTVLTVAMLYIFMQVRNIELLKLRFGESNLYLCEVMVKDITDSKRINSHIVSQLKKDREKEGKNSKVSQGEVK